MINLASTRQTFNGLYRAIEAESGWAHENDTYGTGKLEGIDKALLKLEAAGFDRGDSLFDQIVAASQEAIKDDLIDAHIEVERLKTERDSLKTALEKAHGLLAAQRKPAYTAPRLRVVN